MKILHVIGSLGCGGAQVVLKHIVENMDSGHIEAFVYPLRSKHVDIPVRGNVITRPYCNYDPRKFFTILRVCKKYDIDILVAHLTKPIMGCLLASFFHKCKVVVYEHGPVFEKGPQYTLYRLVLRLLWRRAAAFVAVSKYMSDYLVHKIGIAPERIRVIPNGVDPDIFDPQRVSGKRVRENLGIRCTDIALGFVGRLNHIKGPDLLITATALLLDRSRRYFLLLAGDGPERKYLQESAQRLGIEERVRFLGFREDVPCVMAAVDIAIVPSRQESFGIVCLEFMRMKIPVISSGAGGMAEYITDGQTGLLLNENTPDEICRCVERLQSDKQLRQRLIEGGSRLAEQFRVAKYVKATQRLYEEVLHKED